MRNVLLSLLALALAGCPNAPAPCTICPKIDGVWQMVYQPLDGGTDSSPDCATISAPAGPSTIEIFQSRALLHATINGITCQGQIADTYDFSITGTQYLAGDAGNVLQVTLHGYYVPGADAGTLQAKWTTHNEVGAKYCDADQSCVGKLK